MESELESFIGKNKKLLQQYALSFPSVEAEAEVSYKLATLTADQKVQSTGDAGFTLLRCGEYTEEHDQKKSGTAVQRSQTRADSDDEATSHPPLYATHSGEGILFTSPEQVLGWLKSVTTPVPQQHDVPTAQGAHTARPPQPNLDTARPPQPNLDEDAAEQRTKKRQRVKEDERVYKLQKKFNTCRACGQPKLKETPQGIHT
ncbi:hypothetical protein EGW08_017904 [Elysia chlorotica]|uniref:Uncharacterized protein n=1 Tax=Elysia chlorotica TaxID=188477 RepID=A0A3S1BT95_ELYCH|nr:hypothetical protein EGW08_017904 [Elysia chlorotica]